MSKIICDICGTTYQDTAECCPICGFTNEAAADMLGEDLTVAEVMEDGRGKKGRFTSQKRKEIFDYDEVNSAAQMAADEGNPYEEEEEYEEEAPRNNTLVVVFLTILIALLIAAAAFLFLRFYLPGTADSDQTEPVTLPAVTEQAVETTELTIPCESLVLTSGTASGDAELVAPGQKFLLNVIATPADTTDVILYESQDESIATVDADGHVVAVGEGETVIMISCGDKQIPCKVVCNFSKEETTAPTVEETVAETEAAVDAGLKDVVLKLDATDRSLAVYYSWQIPLDCDLKHSEIEWRSENPDIASVDEEGTVTAKRQGTTSIIGKYGNQEVSCLVRCR